MSSENDQRYLGMDNTKHKTHAIGIPMGEPRTQNTEPKTLIQPADVPVAYAGVTGLIEDFDYDLTANYAKRVTPISAKHE